MHSKISAPLSSAMVGRLVAGDEVVLSGQVSLVACVEWGADAGSPWPAEVVEGTICCLVDRGPDADGSAGWVIDRIDQPAVDRAVRFLLAAGARGFIASGQCLATASYALRKYGGLFFAVGPNWLAETGTVLPHVVLADDRLPPMIGVLDLDGVALTVAHDTHGRQIAELRSLDGGWV